MSYRVPAGDDHNGTPTPAPSSPAGHIPCAVCHDLIDPAEYWATVVWRHPAAHQVWLAGHIVCYFSAHPVGQS